VQATETIAAQKKSRVVVYFPGTFATVRRFTPPEFAPATFGNNDVVVEGNAGA
jgi:hypothetical protein